MYGEIYTSTTCSVYSKFNISYIYETQFYNKYFTEFDLELNGMKIKYSNSDKKNKHYIFSNSIIICYD